MNRNTRNRGNSAPKCYSSDEEPSPSPRKRRKSKAAPVQAEPLALGQPDLEELKHLYHFLLAQLRFEYQMSVSETESFVEFDRKLASIDPKFQGRDVQAMQKLMDAFLSKVAKGDRWMPIHAVLGEHEKYITTRINGLQYLSEGDRYALACAFSGSRWKPLFDTTIMTPHFPPNATSLSEMGRKILHDPDDAFKRNGKVHKAFQKFWGAAGGKLHTTAYNCYPQ